MSKIPPPTDKPDFSGEQLTEAAVEGVQDASLTEMRRNQICEAALELFLQKGFDATTIRDICAKSGVNQASIYDYIANKNDILRRLLNQLWFRPGFPTLAQRLEPGGTDVKEEVAAFYRDAWSEKRKGTLLVYRSVPYLTDEDKKTMRNHDEAVLADLARRLRKCTGLKEDDERAVIIANLLIFLAAFAPMRDWLTRDIDNELALDTVATAVTAIVDNLAKG